MNQQIARLARRNADQQTARLADLPTGRLFLATVTVTAPLTVSWRGRQFTAAGAFTSYTPAITDRVLCALVDNQPVVLGQIA